MSREIAEKFVAGLASEDEAIGKIVRESGATGSLLEGASKVAQAAIAAGWDMTTEELAEAVLSLTEVDDKELASVSGGRSAANCTDAYYKEDCVATIDSDSFCWSDDWCLLFDNRYTIVDNRKGIPPVTSIPRI